MTQQKLFNTPFSPEGLSKFLSAFQTMPFDMQSFMETQRKNFQCISEAQQMVFQNFQAVMTRQAELLSQTLESQSALTSELMREGKPEDKLAKNAEAIKNNYEQAMANAAEISEMVKKANAEAASLLNKRVSASMREVKFAMVKSDAA